MIKAIGPYSLTRQAGQFLFCSGQIPLNADGNIVSGSIEDQTKQVMANLGSILKNAGCDYKDIVKTTIYLTDLNNFDAVNKIYAEYFSEPFPTRATVQVSGLPKGSAIEIEAIALIS
jgi:2-iminobutanoate/2-iminopropanoate deaminase